MKRILLVAALCLVASPVAAKDYNSASTVTPALKIGSCQDANIALTDAEVTLAAGAGEYVVIASSDFRLREGASAATGAEPYFKGNSRLRIFESSKVHVIGLAAVTGGVTFCKVKGR